MSEIASCFSWLHNRQPGVTRLPIPRGWLRPVPEGWAQIVLTLYMTTQQGKGSLREGVDRWVSSPLLSSPQLTCMLWLKVIPAWETCCWTMHKTLGARISSSEWLHSEHAGVKGLWEGSLSFLEGLNSPGLCPGSQPPCSVSGTLAPRTAHTEGSQVGSGWEQLPSPNIPQGLSLDPLNEK